MDLETKRKVQELVVSSSLKVYDAMAEQYIREIKSDKSSPELISQLSKEMRQLDDLMSTELSFNKSVLTKLEDKNLFQQKRNNSFLTKQMQKKY